MSSLAMADLQTTVTNGSGTTSSTASLFPNLPDDISLHILARVPRSHYPSLSLVSKSWRSTISSPDLYATRSLLGTTQTPLYLNIRSNSSFNWFFQPNPPNPNPTLTPLPSIPHFIVGSSVTVLGPNIYLIGGSVDDISSNNVWIFDCRFRKWEMGPRMRVSREFSAAEAWGGKVYVIGGCNADSWTKSENWAEVFEAKTGTWTPVFSGVPSNYSWILDSKTGSSSGGVEVRDKWMHASAMIGSRLYAMADRGGVVLDVETGEWGSVPKRLDMGWRGRAAVVDDVLYCYDYLGNIRGYDVGCDKWQEVRLTKVGGGLPRFMCGATMVNLDGKLCVVWEEKGKGKEVDILCAELEVRKDVDGGFSGTILRSDKILVVPKGAAISHCLAVRF